MKWVCAAAILITGLAYALYDLNRTLNRALRLPGDTDE